MIRNYVNLIITIFLFSWIPPTLAGKTEVQETIEGTTRVTAEQVIELVEGTPDLVIIDARKAADYEKGFIEGAIDLPDTETTEASLAAHVASKNTPVLFYCNGVRCGRSVKSSKMAVSWDYTNIYWFRGGWGEWTEKGYPASH